MNALLALGCSHTAAVGIKANLGYAQLLANKLDLHLVNCAVPGGNHNSVLQNLCAYLNQHTPELIIAQWPNPFRITEWNKNNKAILQNVHNAGTIFNAMVKSGPANFIEPWLQAIIVANMLCRARSIPVINILLETQDQYIHQRLSGFQIELHQDDKLPGKTWFFDSAASDGYHHSADCHAKWCQRIIDILNENTPR